MMRHPAITTRWCERGSGVSDGDIVVAAGTPISSKQLYAITEAQRQTGDQTSDKKSGDIIRTEPRRLAPGGHWKGNHNAVISSLASGGKHYTTTIAG
jgi:hypothetical protein